MTRAADAVLRLHDVAKWFPVRSRLLRRVVGQIRAVDNCSLEVFPGETVGLVGESGSGKSTLGRLALRLIAPSSGSVVLDGMDITELSPHDLRPLRRHIQMVFQDPYSSLDPHSTIGESIGEPLFNHFGLKGKARDDRVGDLLEKVQLRRAHVSRYPHEFSGGQLQRVALARALALEPKVIVADEPVSSLDVSTQAQVLKLLMLLQKELGVAYLFISHDLSVVHHLSDRIAVMYLGRLVEVGSSSSVVESPKHPYTRALLSAVPSPHPSAQRSDRVLLLGDPPSPLHPPSGCRFHTRCPHAMPVCREVDPAAHTTSDGTTVFCHLYA